MSKVNIFNIRTFKMCILKYLGTTEHLLTVSQ